MAHPAPQLARGRSGNRLDTNGPLGTSSDVHAPLPERLAQLTAVATKRVRELAEKRSHYRHANGITGETEEDEHRLMVDDWVRAEEELCAMADRLEKSRGGVRSEQIAAAVSR